VAKSVGSLTTETARIPTSKLLRGRRLSRWSGLPPISWSLLSPSLVPPLLGNESSLTSGWPSGNERRGLALLGVAEPPHARPLRAPTSSYRHVPSACAKEISFRPWESRPDGHREESLQVGMFDCSNRFA
jgi:hypothetical protein